LILKSPFFIPIAGFEIVGELLIGQNWFASGFHVAINLDDTVGGKGKELKASKNELKKPIGLDIEIKMEVHVDVGCLYEPLEDMKTHEKLNFAIQPSFQLNAMIGKQRGIEEMARDIRDTNHWFGNDFYSFLSGDYSTNIQKLDQSLTKLAVAQRYGLSCFVKEVGHNKGYRCWNLARTTNIAEDKGRENSAEYHGIYNEWKETCETFYKSFNDAYLAAKSTFMCPSLGSFTASEKHRVTGQSSFQNDIRCDEEKFEKYQMITKSTKISTRDDIEAKYCIRKWYDFISNVKDTLGKTKKKMYNTQQRIDTNCTKKKDLCSNMKYSKLIKFIKEGECTPYDICYHVKFSKVKRFFEGMTFDSNMWFGGLYPTNGWQLGLGLVFLDRENPDSLLGPKWFIQISDFLEETHEAKWGYSSFTIATLPWSWFLNIPDPMAAFRGRLDLENQSKRPYISITFKIEWPLLPLNKSLNKKREIHHFCGDPFKTECGKWEGGKHLK